jgi:hypothetical protein
MPPSTNSVVGREWAREEATGLEAVEQLEEPEHVDRFVEPDGRCAAGAWHSGRRCTYSPFSPTWLAASSALSSHG